VESAGVEIAVTAAIYTTINTNHQTAVNVTFLLEGRTWQSRKNKRLTFLKLFKYRRTSSLSERHTETIDALFHEMTKDIGYVFITHAKKKEQCFATVEL
jgi:hypothetical protein